MFLSSVCTAFHLVEEQFQHNHHPYGLIIGIPIFVSITAVLLGSFAQQRMVNCHMRGPSHWLAMVSSSMLRPGFVGCVGCISSCFRMVFWLSSRPVRRFIVKLGASQPATLWVSETSMGHRMVTGLFGAHPPFTSLIFHVTIEPTFRRGTRRNVIRCYIYCIIRIYVPFACVFAFTHMDSTQRKSTLESCR